MVTSFILIIWWIFACYGLIVSKIKSIKDEFDAIIPYQGVAWILLIFFFLKDLLSIGATIALFSDAPLLALLQVIAIITKLVLWFVLTYGLITKYVLTSDSDTKEKTDKMYNSLTLVQVPFGIIAICIGLLGLIINFIY